jgi:hypothetical protein
MMWRFRNKHHIWFEAPLELWWALDGDRMSDSYDDDTDPFELWCLWIRRYCKARVVDIWWTVMSPPGHAPGIIEPAPFDAARRAIGMPDFLDYFTWPVDADHRPLRWTELPVVDKVWREDEGDTGGFIQELTRWKPSPLQPSVDIGMLAAACRLSVPGGRDERA